MDFNAKLNDETQEDTTDVILDENGKAAIFFGSAKLNQGTKYTFKVQINSELKTWNAFVVDADGEILGGKNGTTQQAFVNAGLGKIEVAAQRTGTSISPSGERST
jgi:hypothetical protein